MSHEIRTPLNAILGNVELLRRDDLKPSQIERIGHLESSAKYLLGTLSDVLELSKIEAGDLSVSEVDFMLDDVLAQVDAVMRDAAAAKNLQLQIAAGEVPYALRGDPVRLAQVLVNYVSNAIKFTAHGEIRVAVRQVAEDVSSCELMFEVHDTGTGISAESSAQLFSAFERGSHLVRGAGLGLAINARLAELMKGTVGATGEPGKGSVFWLSLPLGKVTDPHDADTMLSAEQLIERDHCGATVLLVEDEPMNQAVALALLRDIGLDPVLATDGLEALRRIETQDFALVLMDMKMPRLDGLQATTAIRALPGREHLPIVAMTANAFREDRERCLAAGMNDFIGKPFHVDELCEKLLRWLRQSS
jgi:two-component system sensor histidine kinase/response regulator